MSKVDGDKFLAVDETEELPKTVVEFLRDKTEPRIVVPTPEGWRNSLPDVDIDAKGVRSRSAEIREESLKRIKEKNLSAGETFFLQQASKEA
jgi:hypothetical protein